MEEEESQSPALYEAVWPELHHEGLLPCDEGLPSVEGMHEAAEPAIWREGGKKMLRIEERKVVIEIETAAPALTAHRIMHDLVYAMGAINKDLVDNETDCIYWLCELLKEMIPGEDDLEKMEKARAAES